MPNMAYLIPEESLRKKSGAAGWQGKDGSKLGHTLKKLIFIASSHDDLLDFPEIVRREVGFALHLAQQGDRGLNVLPLVGFGGAGVIEVVSNHAGDTFRAVYTITLGDFVYVLHAFKKKSKSGRATPQEEMNRIRTRLRAAKNDYAKRTKKSEKKSAG